MADRTSPLLPTERDAAARGADRPGRRSLGERVFDALEWLVSAAGRSAQYDPYALGWDGYALAWEDGQAVPREVNAAAQRTGTERVLFLCIGNSARSQMAEGLLRHLGGDRYEAHSAGVIESHVRPETVEVMREVGIDVSGQRSKKADVYAGQQFDLVVTTCDEAKEACPLFPGARRMLHWSIPEPLGLEGFRAARDQLRGLIEKELLGAHAKRER